MTYTRQQRLLGAAILLHCSLAGAIGRAQSPQPDTDRDGLSDALEQRLLEQFRPAFQVGRDDCSAVPAEFAAGVVRPHVQAEDGTIYGQVYPAAGSTRTKPEVEIHYYHLWRRDCGGHGHTLDAEHVSVLVLPSGPELEQATWRAAYWYAAAHENTVCDVSQIARASALGAEEHGATVWISPGKHASYLQEALCGGGCGADRCERMEPLPAGRVINLGELHAPMNGSVFVSSAAWPLAGKMTGTNFPADVLARVDGFPVDNVVLFHAGRHPAQGIIARSSATEQSLAHSGADTAGAVGVAGDATGDALNTAGNATGNALDKSYRKTRHALGSSVRHVGKALGMDGKEPDGPKE